MSSYFVGRHRPRAGNVSGGVFGRRAYVDHHDIAASQPGCELVSGDRLDVAPVAEIRGREPFDPGDVFGGHIAQRRPELTDSLARKHVKMRVCPRRPGQQAGARQRVQVM